MPQPGRTRNLSAAQEWLRTIELDGARVPPATEPRLLRIQLNALAAVLEIKEPTEEALADLKGPAFDRFSRGVHKGLKHQLERGMIRSRLAEQLIRSVESGDMVSGPPGFRHDLVVPAIVNDGVMYGALKPPRLVTGYGKDPVIAGYEREPGGMRPEYVNINIRRGNVLSLSAPPSFRYELNVYARFSSKNFLGSEEFAKAVASIAGPANVDVISDPKDQQSRTLKLKPSGIEIAWKRTEDASSITFDCPYKTSLKELEKDQMQLMYDLMERMAPQAFSPSAFERLVAVAEESNRLQPVKGKPGLHEYSPYDKECRRYLFGRSEEKTGGARPGKGGSYPLQTPVRECVNNIFAIGGASTEFMSEIVRISGKAHPKVLFLPTASSDEESRMTQNAETWKKHGATCESLPLIFKAPPQEEIEKAIREADIIFVGGGNTHMMMRCWARHGVDKMLEEAARRGAVMSGYSAGAICWFQSGNSDSLHYYRNSPDYVRVRGLDFVDAMLVPHWSPQSSRRPFVEEQMKKSRNVAICLSDGAAIHIQGDRYRIVVPPEPEYEGYGDGDYPDIYPIGQGAFVYSKGYPVSVPSSKAQRVFWNGSRTVVEDIPVTEEYRPVAELTDKTTSLNRWRLS